MFPRIHIRKCTFVNDKEKICLPWPRDEQTKPVRCHRLKYKNDKRCHHFLSLPAFWISEVNSHGAVKLNSKQLSLYNKELTFCLKQNSKMHILQKFMLANFHSGALQLAIFKFSIKGISANMTSH